MFINHKNFGPVNRLVYLDKGDGGYSQELAKKLETDKAKIDSTKAEIDRKILNGEDAKAVLAAAKQTIGETSNSSYQKDKGGETPAEVNAKKDIHEKAIQSLNEIQAKEKEYLQKADQIKGLATIDQKVLDTKTFVSNMDKLYSAPKSFTADQTGLSSYQEEQGSFKRNAEQLTASILTLNQMALDLNGDKFKLISHESPLWRATQDRIEDTKASLSLMRSKLTEKQAEYKQTFVNVLADADKVAVDKFVSARAKSVAENSKNNKSPEALRASQEFVAADKASSEIEKIAKIAGIDLSNARATASQKVEPTVGSSDKPTS